MADQKMSEDAIRKSNIRFRFGALEARLAEMHGIDNEKRTNFQARLKNLHRLGFPAGIGGKAGKATLYDEGQMVQMALAVEMIQAGLLPERLIEVFNENSFAIYMAVSTAAHQLLAHPNGFSAGQVDPDNDPFSMFLYFDPSALAPLMEQNEEEDRASATFFYGGSGIVRENIVRWTTGPLRRLTLINITTMLWDLVEPLGETGQKIFFHAVINWCDEGIEAGDFDLMAWVNGTLRQRVYGDSDERPDPMGARDPWGDISLTDLLNKSGFVGYAGQLYNIPEDHGSPNVPDLIINMPGERSIIVDEKALKADAISAYVDHLITRPYRTMYTDRDDYVVLYIPEGGQLEAALAASKDLFQRAFQNRILLASPANLVAIFETVEMVWGVDDERVESETAQFEKSIRDMSDEEVDEAIIANAVAAGMPEFVIRSHLEAGRPERERIKARRAREREDRQDQEGAEDGDGN